MDKDLKTALFVWRMGKWVLAAMAAVTSGWAAVSAYAHGLFAHDVIMIAWWAVGMSAGALFILFNLGDRAIGWFDRFQQGHRVAKTLTELDSAGEKEMNLQSLTLHWVGGTVDPKNVVQMSEYTIKLRTLKFAGWQGLLSIDKDIHGDIHMGSVCKTKDAAEFFRKRKWLDVKEGEWPPNPKI